MTGRLIIAIVSTLLEEAIIIGVVLWGLPKLGIHIPLWGLIVLTVAWVVYSVTTYRSGSRALRKKPQIGLPHMVGSKGKVVSPLIPEGQVKIRSELWRAKSTSGSVDMDEEVTVVGQEGLKLIVSKGAPQRKQNDTS